MKIVNEIFDVAGVRRQLISYMFEEEVSVSWMAHQMGITKLTLTRFLGNKSDSGILTVTRVMKFLRSHDHIGKSTDIKA